MKRLYGVTTAMVTPLDEKGNPQLDQLDQLTEFLISKGVHCLYPLGTTGEMLRLSVKERKAVAERIVQKVAGRVTVYVHVGAMKQEDTISLAQHAHAIGADGIGVVTPIYFSASEQELEEYFVNVSSSVPEDFPVYLYNIPQCASNDLSANVAQNVANRCKNVIGIKYSYPDLLRVNEYLGINEGQFSVLPGVDKLFLAELAMGCDGVVSGVSCVYPEPFVELYNSFKNNDLESARKFQKLAIDICETLKSGSNMAYFKSALKMRGLDVGYMKAPQMDLSESEKSILEENLKEIDSVWTLKA
ncbi:4-hydroxy-tetrahydrodipicolinate synthase [Salirhabdus euzebyi]|uniref:4-hydroxy-tetrahydrodipicolinate synthase n=1 Tax=Salirhabdus euzebyi TaxID=394506 RepID=A0A841Q7M4_9BACI|nr:dihydrodipicolinate synthase family protein [Salirhabdus euzebyi]MBB6454579.1 4-hydroxy-tetrahydrodipicolinate synthase [Salirhabdus euzebyi]